MGDAGTMDVAITVNNNAAPLVMAMMMRTPEAIAMMVMTTILLATAPVNVTISWTMTTNDDDNDADNRDDGKDSLPLPMMVTTAEMTTGMMGGSGVRKGNMTISWTRGT